MMNPKAEDLAVRVWFRFIRLESRLQIAVSERLREIGLSVPQCDVLTTLTEAEGVSQQDLAKRLYVTKGNISGLLDRLEGAGLVERRSTAADRRQYEIYLTPAGREAAERAICIQHELIGATLGRLPAEDLAAFENLLIATRDLFRAQGGSRPTKLAPGDAVGDRAPKRDGSAIRQICASDSGRRSMKQRGRLFQGDVEADEERNADREPSQHADHAKVAAAQADTPPLAGTWSSRSSARSPASSPSFI